MPNEMAEKIKILRKKRNMTLEDVAKIVGVGKSTVRKWETGMIENMKKDKIKKLADALQTTPEYLMGWEKDDKKAFKGVLIPVLGNVQAGIPIQAMQEILDYEEISEQMARQGEYFGLRIKGDSMEHYILEGDVVIVRQQSDVDSGKIAVVLVNGTDATVKRINKEENGIYLVANNPAYMPKFYTKEQIEELPVQIIGEVVEIRRKTS